MAESDRRDSDADLRRLVAGLPADGPCLDDATWERLAGHELPAFERERALDHITTCANCTPLYRALRSLESGARTFDPGVPGAPEAAPRPAGESTDARESWGFGVWQLAAAALVVVTAGALIWSNASLRRANARLEGALAGAAAGQRTAPSGPDDTPIAELRRRLAEASAPQLNVALVSLEPDALRGDPAPATIVLPADARLVTIVLNTADEREYQDHELKILDGRGALVWSGRGLRKSPRNTFTLSVPREVLGAGEYRLELAGLRDGRPGPGQSYHVRVSER